MINVDEAHTMTNRHGNYSYLFTGEKDRIFKW